MRTLLVVFALAVALAACAGSRPPASFTTATPWAPPTGVASIECRLGEDVESPGPALEAACQEDPACGCAELGHALLMSSDGAVGARVLAVLDGACHRGVLRSCQETAMVEELCVRGTARPSSACDVLESQRRLGAAQMQAR
jgi:hypothetical protein